MGLVALPDHGRSVVPGHMTPGHERLACVECRAAAPGTTRRQVRANVLLWAGFRRTGASFGHEPGSRASCTGCHARDDDRHPSFRFREPRFAAVNRTLDACDCLTCHDVHGNHPVRAPHRFEEARDLAAVRASLADGPGTAMSV